MTVCLRHLSEIPGPLCSSHLSLLLEFGISSSSLLRHLVGLLYTSSSEPVVFSSHGYQKLDIQHSVTA